MSIQNKIIVIVTTLSLLACTYYRSKKPSAQELVSKVFTVQQVKEVKVELEDWIEGMRHYNMSNIRTLNTAEWVMLDPIFLRSDYKRAVALIPKWYIRDDEAYNSMVWICGFRHHDNWYFSRPSETQYMTTKKGIEDDYSPLKWKKTRSTIDDYTKNYIIYDKGEKEWVINDRWFRKFMDNSSWLLQDEITMTDKEILTLPDSFWEEKYMVYQMMEQRYIELIDEKWKNEDLSYKQGGYSKSEWDSILKMRNPVTDDDWKKVREYHSTLGYDPFISSTMDSLFPGYTEAKKRRDNWGKKRIDK